jgi:hypothetical protein
MCFVELVEMFIPDEKSVVTYLCCFYKKFAVESEVCFYFRQKDRLEIFVLLKEEIISLRNKKTTHHENFIPKRRFFSYLSISDLSLKSNIRVEK